jgi:hypothetical protein
MRLLLALAVLCSATLAAAKSPHAKLLESYTEADTWRNRSNLYVGARGGIAIPAGTFGLTPSVGLELGVAPSSGWGLGLHVIFMDHPPGAPIFNVPPALWGFGAAADVRYSIPAVDVLSLYPSLSVGFLAGPAMSGSNMVMGLFNPGVGAKLKIGNYYASFEFGLSGFTIPFINLGFGYEGDRRQERAEAWALEREEEARENAAAANAAPVKAAPVTPELSAPPAAPEGL